MGLLKVRNSKINSIHSDFMSFEINNTYSLVMCIEALGYFDNWNDFFIKIFSVLKDDGRFIFTHTQIQKVGGLNLED